MANRSRAISDVGGCVARDPETPQRAEVPIPRGFCSLFPVKIVHCALKRQIFGIFHQPVADWVVSHIRPFRVTGLIDPHLPIHIWTTAFSRPFRDRDVRISAVDDHGLDSSVRGGSFPGVASDAPSEQRAWPCPDLNSFRSLLFAICHSARLALPIYPI